MKKIISIDRRQETPVYKQIRNSIEQNIENGKLLLGDQLPSINKLAKEHSLASGTIIRAYEELREIGIISSKQGKGYYISSIQINQKTKVFLLFDRMNAYKEILYDAIFHNLNAGIEVDVFFHHYDFKRFEKLIRENFGKYNFYAIMPHFNQDISKILSRIPERKLIILDKSVPELKGKFAAVYQDFENDIYSGLTSQKEKILRYKRIVFSSSESPFQFVPEGCIKGFRKFCCEFDMQFEIVNKLDMSKLQTGTVYLLYSDSELISLIKEIEIRNWTPGKDIGIISYDETPMKEILAGGIAVLSTDFKKMGITAAEFISGQPFCHIANTFRFILRSSL